MTWEQRYRVRLALRTSLVPWAVLSLVAAPAVRWFDLQTEWTLFGYGPDGSRAVLGALAGAMLTFIVFVLSAMRIVVQLAGGQMTPRIVALLFSMRWLKVTLGAFTFAYTLSALARVGDRVPGLRVGVAVLLVTTLAGLLPLIVAARWSATVVDAPNSRAGRPSPVVP